MGRKILALVCGLITAWGIIIIDKLIAIGGWPTGSAVEFMTRDEIVSYFSTQPLAFNITLLIGSVLGGYFGGVVVTGMSRQENSGVLMSVAVGLFLILGGIFNFFFLLPGSPAWLIAATLAAYIPVTVLGNRYA